MPDHGSGAGRGAGEGGKRLRALARWVKSGGPEGLQALRDAKRKPAKDDLPPPTGWEGEIWEWFRRLCEGKPALVPRDRWLRICELQGWDLDIGFDLLDEIERVIGSKDEAEDPHDPD